MGPDPRGILARLERSTSTSLQLAFPPTKLEGSTQGGQGAFVAPTRLEPPSSRRSKRPRDARGHRAARLCLHTSPSPALVARGRPRAWPAPNSRSTLPAADATRRPAHSPATRGDARRLAPPPAAVARRASRRRRRRLAPPPRPAASRRRALARDRPQRWPTRPVARRQVVPVRPF